MKQSVKSRIDKLACKLPPSWSELEELFWKVAKRPLQSELDALRADEAGIATDEQKVIANEYLDKNAPRAWAVFDIVYPKWTESSIWERSENETTQETH